MISERIIPLLVKGSFSPTIVHSSWLTGSFSVALAIRAADMSFNLFTNKLGVVLNQRRRYTLANVQWDSETGKSILTSEASIRMVFYWG